MTNHPSSVTNTSRIFDQWWAQGFSEKRPTHPSRLKSRQLFKAYSRWWTFWTQHKNFVRKLDVICIAVSRSHIEGNQFGSSSSTWTFGNRAFKSLGSAVWEDGEVHLGEYKSSHQRLSDTLDTLWYAERPQFLSICRFLSQSGIVAVFNLDIHLVFRLCAFNYLRCTWITA